MASLGVFASIFDCAGRILLVRQAYGSRRWTTPGGRVEEGESPVVALQREVIEEIACEVRISHLIGVYAKPYRDDLVLSFAATLISGNPRSCPPEISEIGFFAREQVPSELAFNSRVRVEDAFENCRGVIRVFESRGLSFRLYREMRNESHDYAVCHVNSTDCFCGLQTQLQYLALDG